MAEITKNGIGRKAYTHKVHSPARASGRHWIQLPHGSAYMRHRSKMMNSLRFKKRFSIAELFTTLFTNKK